MASAAMVSRPPPRGRRSPAATAVATISAPPSSGTAPTAIRPLAGSALTQTRCQPRNAGARAVATATAPVAVVTMPVTPSGPIDSVAPMSSSASLSTVAPPGPGMTASHTSAVQVSGPASRRGGCGTTAWEPSRIGWCRPSKVTSKCCDRSSKRSPGPSGFGSPEITRTSRARAWPPSRTLMRASKRSPGRCEKRSR